jgi:hypothetical protein
MIQGLEEVISSNQGAFIPKRGIAKNILLAQEVKIDLMKAYDSLEWEYILTLPTLFWSTCNLH